MNELESLEKSAFNCAKNIIEHIEHVINDYMQENDISLEDWQQNGSYTEKESPNCSRECFITYNKKVIHQFRYNALGIIG